jgi:sugar transport system permease protein
LELDVIATTIVGGAGLFGGKGRITRTLVGVQFLGFISNGMTVMDVSSDGRILGAGC